MRVNLQSLVTDGATLRTAAGFPSVRTASVLFEETFYNARDERCVTLESHCKRNIACLLPLICARMHATLRASHCHRF